VRGRIFDGRIHLEMAMAEVQTSVAEKHYRSLVKAVSWRCTGTLDTMMISFLITGKIKYAVSIGGVEVFTKIFLYYAHERVWHRIPFGKARNAPPYQI
jgi:uncharacterized membrane protein